MLPGATGHSPQFLPRVTGFWLDWQSTAGLFPLVPNPCTCNAIFSGSRGIVLANNTAKGVRGCPAEASPRIAFARFRPPECVFFWLASSCAEYPVPVVTPTCVMRQAEVPMANGPDRWLVARGLSIALDAAERPLA
jgi:hypothetical protein